MVWLLDHNRIILFDGICNLCIGIVQFIIRRDKKALFKFASLQSDIGKSLSSHYGLPENSLDTFVYIKNNRAYLKSTAALKVLKDIGWPYFFLYVFIVFPKFFRDRIYDWFAGTRYNRFGKRKTCMVPEPEMMGRFLDYKY